MLSPLFRVHLSTVFHLSLSPPTLLLFFATAFRSLPQSAASPRRATPAKADEHPALVFARPTDRLVRVNQFSITAQPGEQDGVTDRRSKAERRDAEHQPSPRGRSLDRTIRFYRPRTATTENRKAMLVINESRTISSVFFDRQRARRRSPEHRYRDEYETGKTDHVGVRKNG